MRPFGLFRKPQLVMAAGVSVAVVAACSNSAPPAASPGFFPANYTGAMVINAPLAKSAEVGPRKSRLTFHVSVPKGQAYAVVVRCDRGRVEASLPGGTESGPCTGSKLGFIDNGCAGDDHTLLIRVSEPQPSNWGVALYTGRDVASTACS